MKTASATTAAQPAVFRGTLATISATITCKKVASTGTLTNVNGVPMKFNGVATTKYSECETLIGASLKNCKVEEPVTIAENISSVVVSGEMYVNAEVSGEIKVIQNPFQPPCPPGILKLSPYKVQGNAIGTPNGATLEFKEKEAHNTLQIGGNAAELAKVETLRMTGGNPIGFTTEKL